MFSHVVQNALLIVFTLFLLNACNRGDKSTHHSLAYFKDSSYTENKFSNDKHSINHKSGYICSLNTNNGDYTVCMGKRWN